MISASKYCLLIWVLKAMHSLTWAISTSDFCIFDDQLKEKFRNLKCHVSDLDQCASQARQLAQNNLSGTWGAIVVADKQMILDEQLDWFVHTVNPQPGRCRLIINDTIVMEVFRTGYRNHSKQWSWRQTKTLLENPRHLDNCPHSTLRELIGSYSHQGISHRGASYIFALAKGLAQAFRAETKHDWNVFVTKNISQNANKIGFNFPHYLYDARSGVCIGQTLDEYNVSASIVGFADHHEEITSGG